MQTIYLDAHKGTLTVEAVGRKTTFEDVVTAIGSIGSTPLDTKQTVGDVAFTFTPDATPAKEVKVTKPAKED